MIPLDRLVPRWPALSLLLDEALALPAAERERWLDSLVNEQAEFRETLRELLAGHASVETGDFMGTLPRLGQPGSAGAIDAEPVAGDTVGPYRLISELGRGGMGAVWLAERADGQLKRQVALKLPRLAWGSALAERLARERDILATLAHPNIARLYDAGVDAQGRPFLALEYVDGRPIDVQVREGGLDVKATLALVLQVAAAVAHAHSRLVIHRDLKPSNVLVTAEGQVRLLDFGIAKLLESERTAETALTRAAGRALTLDYASPEQVRGEALSTTSDVYSLGVLAYEMLAGARPYRLKRGSAAELEEAIASANVQRASDAASVATRKKQLRGDLDAILAKAMAQAQTDRYASVATFAEDIQRHLQGFAVLARPESRWYKARKFVRRQRVMVAAASAVVLALGAGLAAALWQARIARESLTRVERTLERENAARDLYFEAFSSIAAWEPARFAEPRSVITLLHGKLKELEKRYEARPDQRLALLELVGSQLPYLGDHEGALDVSRRYLTLLWGSDPHPSQLLDGYKQVARIEHNLGRLDDAEATLREGMAKVPRQARAPLQRARLYSQLGMVLHKQGRRVEALALMDLARGWLDGAQPADDTLWELLRIKTYLLLGHDDPEALRVALRSHQGLMNQANAQTAPIGVSYMALASAQSMVGRPAEAEAALREALGRLESMYGPVDRDTVLCVSRLAHAMAAQGRYIEARELLVQRRALVEDRAGPGSGNALQTINGHQLAVELLHGDLGSAARFVSTGSTKPDPTLIDKTVQPMAEARYLQAVGRAGEAAARTDRALQGLPQQQRRSAAALRLRLVLAESQWAAGEKDAAVSNWKQLVSDMTESSSMRTWTYHQATEWLAVAAAGRGAVAEALALLDRLDRAPSKDQVIAPTLADRADAAWRRVTVLSAAGDRPRARALLATTQPFLQGQHADSPRLTALRRMQAALGG